jgi:Tol biopolymer transport system component
MRATLRPIAFLSVCILVIGIPAATQGQTPRSESILFVSNHEEPGVASALYLMTPFGSTVRRFLPDITGVAMPRRSPNGSQIALVMWPNDGDWSRVHVMDSDGSDLRVLFPEHEGSWAPAWAPDGSRIAFVGWLGGMTEVYVGDTQGGGTKLVGHRVDERFKAGLPSSAPSWSPDGTRIAFTAFKHNNGQSARYIWAMDPDGSDMQELVTHESQELPSIGV